ncbi:polysaccharide deacetylase family protein [Vibrio sp. 10N.286.52.B1]|uniref:polysaccharide deacetylase family protein n=1 Tax=Vibrio sp. 10N.286.52.B1 TaxID=3229712 RepID=UPI00355009FB
MMKVALTFDNSIGEMTGDVLALLTKYQAKATFFCPAGRAQDNPYLMKQVLADKHVIAGNYYDYCDSTELEFSEFIQQVIKSIRVLEQLIHQQINYYRPPFGRLTLEQQAFLNDSGFDTVYCNLDANNPNTTRNRVENMVGNIMTNVRDNSVILCRDVGDSNLTLRALRIVIPMLKQCGYQFVSIDKINLKAANQSEGWAQQLIEEM